MSRWLVHPLAPLIGFAWVTAVVWCAYVVIRVPPPEAADYLVPLGWFYGVIAWMDADARRHRRLPCFDFGLLAMHYFPVSLIWYCFWSRGWRGWLMLGALLGLWLFPYVVALLVWIVVRVLE